MYRVGDKILHPLHGAGVITAIAQQTVLGNIKDYYIVNLLMKNMTISLPVEGSDQNGVRKIVKSETIDEVIQGLKSKKVHEEPANWNRRYKANLDRIKTGDVYETAEVLRNLYLKDKRKGLSMGEKKMMDNAMQLLVGEISISKKVTLDKAKVYIMDALY
ncbi:MAG TPA: CarD family transcriptional regulator [bacterium]|nr:CarD family transcriptional regulator [bacterium]